MNFFIKKTNQKSKITLIIFIMIGFFNFTQNIFAIDNGQNASDLIGQYSDLSGTTVSYTKSGANNSPNSLGLSGVTYNMAIDSVHHRLFVPDFSNNRVLIFNLNSSNQLVDKIPDNVLGQATFYTNTGATTQAGMINPRSVAYDSVNDRLFVAQGSSAHRVTVYDVASITDGENAINVLGQTTFTAGSAAVTQAGMSSPLGIEYDSSNSRLFVANSNRVTVYDVASITNGENAINVLGQTTFTGSGSAITQAGMSAPASIAYDSTGNRLFVVTNGGSRVVVYDVASITDGENAINVLGQTTFTAGSSATTQAGMNNPQSVAFDSNNNRLFVSQNIPNRVTVYDVASITDGENAINVLGQTTFTGSSAAVTQAGLSNPVSLVYDTTNDKLFVGQTNANRITVYDVASITDGQNASDLIGQYSDLSGTTVSYTKSGANNSPNPLGFNGTSYNNAIDTIHHRLFVTDSSNHRVLIFNLNSSNQLVDKIPDNVLGQASFYTNSSATTQGGMNGPTGLVYDSTNDRLFVSQQGNHRVTVYDVASITDGENAINVLGQTTFTGSSAAVTQAGLSSPSSLAYDSTNSRLFVAQIGAGRRITVYDVASITDGENAINVLGQTTFTGNSAAVTQAGVTAPTSLVYDAANSRLFVADSTVNRVLIYDVASITDGENAINVLGQTTFTGSSAANTQSKMQTPNGLSYDSTNSRLFVSDATYNRVLVFDVSSITDGENAINVLGQTLYTTGSAAVTQAGLSNPAGLIYDSTNNLLFVQQVSSNRISIFDLNLDTTAPTITNVSSDKTNGSYTTGEVIDIDVTFSEIVTSTGSVTVTLETGTTDRTCTFTVTSSNTGTCNYTVQSGDTTSDLTVNNISGTINDVALNAMSNFVPTTNLAANKALVIDTTAPTITNVSSDKTNGSYTTGEVIDIDVTFSEIVTSTGSVTVTLETGTTDRTCTFTVTSSNTGTCNYTVQSGDTTSDLTVNNISGTINDVALNAMSNFVPTTNLAANKALVIDTTAPTVTINQAGGQSDPATSNPINFTVVFSEAISPATFNSGDITISGTGTATAGTPTTSNNITWTVPVTATAGGTIIASLDANKVTDVAGNNNTAATSTDNMVTYIPDTTPPILSESTPVTTPTTDHTPDYTFNTDEAGDISYGGSCTASATTATVGDNTITFDTLSDGVYNDCTITVTDASSNSSDPLTVTEFEIISDTTPPILSESTPVTTPTTDHTPDYTFNTDEAGDISYGGSCTASATTATVGDNTITFDTLSDGVYNDCTITVTDASSNSSDPLTVTEFEIISDTTPPILSESTPVTTPTTDHTPDYTFNTDEAGDISYGGSCTASATTATVGDNTITFDTLSDGVYNDCTITVTDASSNSSDPLTVTEFEIISDTTPPILSESTPVTTPTTDHTPDYTFNTDEAGDISYGGSCTASATTATVGDNTITFDTLSDGVYNDCTITVTDASSNSSDPLTVTEFEIDTTAPTITNVSSDKTNGSYTTGEVIDIDVTFSEIVTSTGSVTVTLETGTTDRTCTFTVTSSNTGTCNYTVQSGDTTSDLTVNNISGTINDVALNAMSNFVPTTNLAANKALVIDTTAPTVTTVTENHHSSYGYLPKYNQLQPNTNTTCVSLFTSNINIVLGKINNVDDVKKLETFLNDFQGEKLDVNGIYEQKDFEAVKRFQQKYFTDIISPFNGKQVTGIVAQYTRGKINLLNCAKQIGCPYFTQNQKIGSTNGDVKRIQNFLNLLMGTNIEETGVFDNQTYLSVKKYQNLYKESVLKPLGLKSATGFWYEKSREAGNKLMGCYI